MGWFSRCFSCLRPRSNYTCRKKQEEEERRLSFKEEVKQSLKKHWGLNKETLSNVDQVMAEAAKEMEMSSFGGVGNKQNEEQVLQAIDDGLRAIAVLWEVTKM